MRSPHISRSKLRFTWALLAGISSIGLLAGCAGASGSSTAGGTSGTSQSGAEPFGLSPVENVTKLVPDGLKDKELSIAVYTDGAPQQFLDNGKVVGVQADFAQAVSEVSGLTLNVVGVGSWDSIIPGLQTGRYDSAFADFGITKERQEVFDLVLQFNLSTGFAVKDGSDLTVTTEADLCGLQVATLAGSYFIEQLEAISDECTGSGAAAVQIQTFPAQADAILAVSTGRSQVFATSSDQLAFAAVKDNSGVAVQPFEYAPLPQGIGVAKDSPLGPVYVAALKALIDDGTYQEILDKWDISSAAITADEVVINPL